SRIVLGMKAVVHEGGGTHGNIFRQYGIQCPHPVGRRPVQVSTKACHLSTRMDAGICTACADDGYRGMADLVDGALDGFLDREMIGLALPTGVTGPIVFQD